MVLVLVLYIFLYCICIYMYLVLYICIYGIWYIGYGRECCCPLRVLCGAASSSQSVCVCVSVCLLTMCHCVDSRGAALRRGAHRPLQVPRDAHSGAGGRAAGPRLRSAHGPPLAPGVPSCRLFMPVRRLAVPCLGRRPWQCAKEPSISLPLAQ